MKEQNHEDPIVTVQESKAALDRGDKTFLAAILRAAELEGWPWHQETKGTVGTVRAPSSIEVEIAAGEGDVEPSPDSRGAPQKVSSHSAVFPEALKARRVVRTRWRQASWLSG